MKEKISNASHYYLLNYHKRPFHPKLCLILFPRPQIADTSNRIRDTKIKLMKVEKEREEERDSSHLFNFGNDDL